MANLAGIGGIVEKIKGVIKKLREPIDKAVEKVVGFVADKARALLGRGEKPTASEEKESPEKAKKVALGLTDPASPKRCEEGYEKTDLNSYDYGSATQIKNRIEELKESIPKAQRGRITMAAALAMSSKHKIWY